MKIVCLKGGLGNQMFEYCRFRDLMDSGNGKVYLFYDRRRLKQHDGLRLSDCFELELPSCPWGIRLVVWGLKICRAVGVLKRLYDDERPDARFFFFSDDMEWVRENLWMEDAVYVEHTELMPDYVDLYLMTLCRGHIISNSTFSFWGAYLAVDGNGMKIYPRRWFRDPTWISPPIFSEEWVGL